MLPFASLTARVGNGGSLQAGAGVPVNFYLGDPAAGGTLLGTRTTSRPLFPGHHQPHLPADLGLYDLRVPEVRVAQAELARAHGISAFCYYHYWFEGRRLLERPFDEVLSTGWPDFSFCLCWANERWTRAWDGRDSSVLVEQTYSTADDHAHARWLAQAFADERYLRVDGRPVFLVYRAAALPDARRTTDILRTEAQRAGIGELLLCRVESFRDEHGDPTVLGFDASVEHQPDWTDLGRARRRNLAWRAAAHSHSTGCTTTRRWRSAWRRGHSPRSRASPA